MPAPDALSQLRTSSVDVVLPCLDEAGALPYVLSRMPEGYRAIIVDNGSTDGSAEIARRLGATVLTSVPRGFGSAVSTGVEAASSRLIAIMDADGSLDPCELPRLVEQVEGGAADLVLGRRVPTGRHAWPAHARLGNALLARTIRRRTGYDLHDLGPMRVARTDALQRLAIRDRRSGYPLEMVMRAAAAGWLVRELPVPYRPRTGRSKVTGTIGGTIRAVQDMRAVLAS